MPEIVVLLHAQPQCRTVSRKLADAQRHFRSESFALRQQFMQGLSRDVQSTGGFGDAELERRQNVFAQQRARMRRGTAGIALGDMFGHVSSVILLEVDPQRIAVKPFERDTPGSVDVQAVAGRSEAQAIQVNGSRLRADDAQPAR